MGKDKKLFDRYDVVSCPFQTEDEWYEGVNEYENSLYGEYRYSPWKDFSEWSNLYLYFQCHILGKVAEAEMDRRIRQKVLSDTFYAERQIDVERYYP